MVIGVFFVNSVVYAADLPKATHLRNPLMTNKDEDNTGRLSIGLEGVVGRLLALLDKDAEKNEEKLIGLFIQALSPLKDGNITVTRIESLFRPKDEEIYQIIQNLREIMIKSSLLAGNVGFFIAVNRHEIKSPDLGVCKPIRDSLMKAMKKIDLYPIPESVEEEGEPFPHHHYV